MNQDLHTYVVQEITAIDPNAWVIEAGPTWVRWSCCGVQGTYSTSTSTQGMWRSLIGSGPSVRDAVGLAWTIPDPEVIPPMEKPLSPVFYGFEKAHEDD